MVTSLAALHAFTKRPAAVVAVVGGANVMRWIGGFSSREGVNTLLLVLINVLVIVVIGAICFYLIDKFVRDGRLGNLLKILVVLICLAAIVQRLLPALGVSF